MKRGAAAMTHLYFVSSRRAPNLAENGERYSLARGLFWLIVMRLIFVEVRRNNHTRVGGEEAEIAGEINALAPTQILIL